MYKGRLPEKPIRPNIAGRLAKNLTKKQTNKHIKSLKSCKHSNHVSCMYMRAVSVERCLQ